MSYKPKHPIRIVTAASLFDGHDASINIMRRVLQDMGAEVIHLGHNRSVLDVVTTALQEGAQGIAVSSYQGGHMEYFKYMKDLLSKAGADYVKIFGGGGGVIVHEEKIALEKYTDPEVFAATMANPAKFMEMMALMSDPQSAPKMMECSMKPEQWSVWMTRMSDPSKLMAIMTQFMNPQMYTNWMAASMNPQTFQPMYAFMNPGLYTQWMTVAMNPESYTPMFGMMNPKWQQESATSMMNPNFFQQMFEGFYQPTAVADATSAE